MATALLLWVQFAVAAAVVGYAGYLLVVNANVIAEKTGLGTTFIGVLLLSTITSLPELASGLSAILIAQEPDIAVGDALGSCAFNLLILLLLELLHPKESIYVSASRGHILAAGLGVVLIGLVGAGLALELAGVSPTIGHVGVSTPLIILSYMIALRMIYMHERGERATPPPAHVPTKRSLRKAVLGYLGAAVLVLAAGGALPLICDHLADAMGWNASFMGTTFLALSTSLPEIAVTLAAIRLGALDMAVANLVGSNLFDTVIIAIDDLFYLPGPLLAEVSPIHFLTAASSMIMTGIIVAALIYRPQSNQTRPFRRLGWAGLFLLVVYAANTYFVFSHGGLQLASP